MGNITSIWSKQEENPKTADAETNSITTNPIYNVNGSMPEEAVNGEVDSTRTEIIDSNNVSKKVENTEKATGKAPRRRRRKTAKNKKPAIEDTEISNRVQSQVNDSQQIDTDIGETLKRNIITKSKKTLLVLDVNGLLVEIISPSPKDCKPDAKISKRAIFKRPFVDDFLEFCFERFDVAIWSSRTRKILEPVVDYLLGDLKQNLVFLWDMSHCTGSTFRSLENHHKLIVFKKLGKIWEENGRVASVNGYYDDSNTLLLDDSPYKALLNPKHTGIFPLSYRSKDINDNSLGPGGDLRIYLEGLAASEDVKTYVEHHPFGQRAIDETSPHWAFYSKVLKNVA